MPPMVKSIPMSEFRAAIEPMEAVRRNYFDPRAQGEFSLDSDDHIRFNLLGAEYSVIPDAYVQMGQMMGIPSSYLMKTPHDLMVPHLNHWMRNKEISQVSFGVYDGDIVLWTKGEATPVSNLKIIDHLTAYCGVPDSEVQVVHVSSDVKRTHFNLVTNRFEQSVKVGDTVQIGIAVDNSYSLSTPLEISTYVHRLSCTNGAISADNIFRMSRRQDDEDSWLDEVIEKAFLAADLEVERLRGIDRITLDDHVHDTANSVFMELGVPIQAREIIRDQLIDSKAVTLYDLYNTITWVASNSENAAQDPSLAYRLMTAGGRLAADPELCGSCHRLMN